MDVRLQVKKKTEPKYCLADKQEWSLYIQSLLVNKMWLWAKEGVTHVDCEMKSFRKLSLLTNKNSIEFDSNG